MARRLLGIAPLIVSREEAIALASEAWAQKVGYEYANRHQLWPTPKVHERLDGWIVSMRPNVRSGPSLWVNGQNGEVKGAWLGREELKTKFTREG